jgi:hypothetical protein
MIARIALAFLGLLDIINLLHGEEACEFSVAPLDVVCCWQTRGEDSICVRGS